LANAGAGTASPDALSAAGLAGALHAPVLLTTATALSAGDLAAIQTLGAKTVYVMGGSVAIGPNVIQALKSAGLTVVQEFAGANRFDTAMLVDQYLYANHLSQSKTVYVANGITMVDALSASPTIYQNGSPLILVSSSETSLPTATQQWLTAQGFTNVVILGGPAAVSPTLQNAISAALTAANVTRLSGATRDGTAVAVDTHYYSAPVGVIVAANGSQGGSFVDALGAAELAAMNDIPIVLTNPSNLPTSTTAYLSQQANLHAIWVMGGTVAIQSGVSTALSKDITNP
jgi:minor extracellular serine protease Vpr